MAAASVANSIPEFHPSLVPSARPHLDPRVVQEFIPQVERIARRIHRTLPPHVALEDLVQDGTLGLLDALARGTTSDPAFASYAAIRIAGAIYDSLRSQDGASRHLRSAQRRLRGAAHEIERRTGSAPSLAELAEATGMSLAAVSNSSQAWTEMQLTGYDDEEEEPAPIESIADDPELQPEHRAITAEQQAIIRRSLELLSPSEARVLRLYYFEEVSMSEIAERMRLTCSRVSQIHRRALQRLEPRLREVAGAPGPRSFRLFHPCTEHTM